MPPNSFLTEKFQEVVLLPSCGIVRRCRRCQKFVARIPVSRILRHAFSPARVFDRRTLESAATLKSVRPSILTTPWLWFAKTPSARNPLIICQPTPSKS